MVLRFITDQNIPFINDDNKFIADGVLLFTFFLTDTFIIHGKNADW